VPSLLLPLRVGGLEPDTACAWSFQRLPSRMYGRASYQLSFAVPGYGRNTQTAAVQTEITDLVLRGVHDREIRLETSPRTFLKSFCSAYWALAVAGSGTTHPRSGKTLFPD